MVYLSCTITNHQSPITNHQSPITNHQSPITNHQSPITRTLVVLRCGDHSLHPEWVNENAQFDVVLSYFGDNLAYDLTHIKFVHHYKGSKWEGLYDFFINHQHLWQDYDYIWLPDDDLSTNTDNLNQFFQLCAHYQFHLAQPALTSNSYHSYEILLQMSNTIYRETTFVEIMMPCFSKQAFALCWQTFQENKSGWGLEYLWYQILKHHSLSKIAVLDLTPVFHTRPVGSMGHGIGKDKNNPHHELNSLLKKYQLKVIINYIAILTQENVILENKSDILNHCVYYSNPVRFRNNDSFRIFYHEIMYPFKQHPTKRPRWKKILGVK